MTDVVEVARTRTTDAAVGNQRNLVLNALSDWQSVQRVTKYRSDVLVKSSASDEARSSIQCRLQAPNSVHRSAAQDQSRSRSRSRPFMDQATAVGPTSIDGSFFSSFDSSLTKYFR